MPNNNNIKNTQRAKKSVKPVLTIDWTSDQALVPYYDVENNRYAVTVTLKYETAGQNFRRAYPQEYVEEGVRIILSHFDKSYDNQTAEQLGTALDFFVPERPREKVRVSVGINEDVFESLSNSIQSSTVGKVADEISLNTYNLSKKINGVVKILNSFYEKVKTLDARIYGINFEEEAELLSYLGGSLTSLAENNGYQLLETRSDLLSIGVDSNYSPSYVQFNDGTGFKSLTSGFTAFKNSEPGRSNQSFYYLKNLDQIYADNKKTPSIRWDEFIEKYTIKEYRIELGETRPYSPKLDAPTQKTQDKANQNSGKTQSEKDKETKELQNPSFKKQIADVQNKLVKRIEGGPLQDIKKVEGVLAYPQKTINENLQKVGINGVYYEFFHKYNIQALIKQAIVCLDPNGVIARTYQAAKDFLRGAVRFLEDLIAVLKIPVITLEDLIPTVDILSDIGKQIYLAVMAALKEALVQMLVDIISMIIYACGNPDDMNFGALNIGDLFNDPTNLENWTKFGQEVGGRTLNATLGGISSGINNFSNLELEASKEYIKNINGFLNNETVERLTSEGVFTDGPGSIKQLMREVSSVLTPGETSELLLRGGTATTRTMVQNIVSSSSAYSDTLKDLLSDQNKVSDLFTSAGKLINEEKLLEKVEEARSLLPSEFDGLCSDDPNEQLRRDLLQGKGLTEDEITSQIEKARERRLKRLQQLQEMLEKDNLLDGAIPPLYCSVDENGNIKPGLVDIDHPAFTFTLKRTLNSSFDSIYTSFNTDVKNLIPSMKKERKVKDREIKRAFMRTGDDLIRVRDYNSSLGEDEAKLPEAIINPEFETYYSQGFRPPQTHPNLGSRPGPLPFPTPYTEALRGVTNVATISRSRQLSPDPDIEFAVQQQFGPAASIFVPENTLLLAPGLRDNLREIANTGSTVSYSDYVADDSLDFPNFTIESGFIYLSFESILSQDLSFYAPAGSTGASLQKQLEQLTNIESFGPSRFFVKYDSVGAVGANLVENYTVSFYSLNSQGERASQQALNITEPLDPQVIELLNRENLYLPSLQQVQVSHDQFAYTGLTPTVADLQGAQTSQELQFSQLLQIAASGGSIVREISEPEVRDQIGGISNLQILDALLLPQFVSGQLQSLYIEIYRDFLTAFSSEIANSDLFDNGVLDIANLSPKLTKQQIEDGCFDPHLLNLDAIREIVLNEYQTTKCIDNVISKEDGTGNKDGALEKALVGGAVILTIRFYIIETVLKTIFAFSQFNFTSRDDIPSLITKLVYKKMVSEISRLGYSLEFVKAALDSYNKLAKINQQIPETNEVDVALDFLVRREMMVVQDKINLILGTDENLKIESVVSEGFINCYDVPSGSNEIRFSGDEVNALNDKAELERELLRRGLSEEAIALRERMSAPGSFYSYRSIIAILANGNLAQGAQTEDAPLTLPTQFKFLPLFVRDKQHGDQEPGNVALITKNLLPDWLPYPGQGAASRQGIGYLDRPLEYDMEPIRRTGRYRNTLNDDLFAASAFVDTRSQFYNQQGIAVNGYKRFFYQIDVRYEEQASLLDSAIFRQPNSSAPTFQNELGADTVGWEEIIQNPQERDVNNILVNQPPQFILELWPLFTFALAQSPNGQIVNYDQIYPKFGFNDETSASIAPPKTGYQQLYNPSNEEMQFGFSQRWLQNGLNNTDFPNETYWDVDSTVFERDAVLTMFEMFNNFNLLLPGSAGASFSVPTSNTFPWNAGDGTQGINGSGFVAGGTAMVYERMYELVELPSPNQVYQCYEPVLMNSRWHDLDWQENVPRPGYTGQFRNASWREGSLFRDPNQLGDYKPSSPYEGINGCLYRNYSVSEMPIPRNDYAFNQGVEGKDGFLCEYSFHPKMTHYNIQDATVNDFPEDIKKEIDYYESWSGMSDQELMRFLKRQFISNRTHFKLSYSENQRLEKVGEELLKQRWRGRPIISIDELRDMIDRIYSGFLGRINPEIRELDLTEVHGYKIFESQATAQQLGDPGNIGLGSRIPYGLFETDTDSHGTSDNSEPENLRWIADSLNLFSNPQQIKPRGYQDGLGLRGDVSTAGFSKGYTLIYILDQIKSRLENFESSPPTTDGFCYAPHSYLTFANDQPSRGSIQQRIKEEGDLEWYDNPRRDSTGWVPGAGSPNFPWPPTLRAEEERSKKRVQYTNSEWSPYNSKRSGRGAGPTLPNFGDFQNRSWPDSDTFEQAFDRLKAAKTQPEFYDDLSYVYDSTSGEVRQVPTNTTVDRIEAFRDTVRYTPPALSSTYGSNNFGFQNNSDTELINLTYLQLWEFDWWMSKLTAFMLLEPSFEAFRSIKDYPEFLRHYKSAAEHVKKQFNRDIDFRKKERERILEELGEVFDSRQPTGNILTKFMDNGGLVYEKYIRLKEHDWDELERQATGAQLTQIQNLRAIVENNRDNWLKGAVNIDAFQDWLESYYNSIEQQYDEARELVNEPIPEVITERPGAVKDQCGDGLVVGERQDVGSVFLSRQDFARLSLDDLFDEARFGLRITAVSAPNAEGLVAKISQRSNNTIFTNDIVSTNFGQNEQGNQITGLKSIGDIIELDKAYLLNEEGTYTFGGASNTEIVEISDKYVTIPIISVETQINKDSPLESLIGDQNIITAIDPSNPITMRKMRYLYDRAMPGLLESLKQTDEFKFLFKYCFPIERMFSLNLSYILNYLDQIEQVDRNFANTKENLKVVFNAFLNAGNYKYEHDINNRNLSYYDPTDPNNPNQVAGVDLSSIAIKFPLMVFKSFVEVTDANIKVSNFLFHSANQAIKAVNNTFGIECPAISELPPSALAAISLPLGIGLPPTIPYTNPFTALTYLGLFAHEGNPLRNSDSSKNSSRCDLKNSGGRDFTRANRCNLEDGVTERQLPSPVPSSEQPQANNAQPQQPTPNNQTQQAVGLYDTAYIDDRGRKRNNLGLVIGDDGKLYTATTPPEEVDPNTFS